MSSKIATNGIIQIHTPMNQKLTLASNF